MLRDFQLLWTGLPALPVLSGAFFNPQNLSVAVHIYANRHKDADIFYLIGPAALQPQSV